MTSAATTAAVPATHGPWIYMVLVVPFGLVTGFPTVALAYQLHAAGVGAEPIAALIALSYLPHTWKFLWAPVVDLSWHRPGWYLASSAATAIGIAAMGWWGADGTAMPLLSLAVLAANFASTGVAMSVESLMAYHTPDREKGRAAGWFQAGNLGGMGIGGGLALWLVQEQGVSVFASGVALALLGLACALPLVALRDAHGRTRAPTAAHALEWRALALDLWRDLWSMLRSRSGALAMLVCFLPISSGAASNLWSVLADDWQASANTVALVNGTLGGLIMAAGCLVGGWVCDRMDRKAAYCLFGVLQALSALAMSLTLRTEWNFIVLTSVYSFVQGMAYAGFSSVALEAIGRGAAATKYNLLASLSNVPVAYVTYLDGWAHARWGAGPMLQLEAASVVLGLLLFALAARRRRARPVGA